MVNYPKDWIRTKISDINIKVNRGEYITKKIAIKGSYPVISAGKEPAYYCDRYNRSGVTVTISASGANAGYVNIHYNKIFASDCCTISEAPNYDIRYIYYLLLYRQKEIYDLQTGGAQPHVYPKNIYNIIVDYTSDIYEQQAISNVLSTFDEHIKNLNNLIEKKKAIRDGALEDLVTGKIRLDGFKEDWDTLRLSNVSKIYDGTHQTPNYTNKGIPFVSVENIKDLNETDKYISESDFIRNFSVYPEYGDILMTRIGDIGTPAIVNTKKPIAYYVSLALLKDIKINPYFLNYYILGSYFKKELYDRTLHYAIPIKINKKDIGECLVSFPKDIKEQQAIADILISMDKEIENLEREKDKIIQIKEGAMDDLLTGRIRLV